MFPVTALACSMTLLAWATARADDPPASSVGPVAKAKTAKPKDKRFGKLGFGAMLGGGFDSNVFNKKDTPTQAGLGEINAKLSLDVPAVEWMSWSSNLGVGGSYRTGNGDFGASAAKIDAKLRTGLHALLPVGRLSFDIKYGFGASPVVTDPAETVDPPEVFDSEVEDLLDDNDFDDDDFEDGNDEGQADEDDDGEFVDDNALEGKSFGLKGGKHRVDGALKFSLEPIKKTTLSLKGSGTRGIVSVDEERPSADYNQLGSAIGLKQKLIGEYLAGLAGYGIDYRTFDEKTVESGDDLTFLIHKFSAGIELKPIQFLKLKLSYKYRHALVGADENLDSRKHQLRFDAQVKLTKQVALVAETAFAESALLITDAKDATRFQGLLGLKVKM